LLELFHILQLQHRGMEADLRHLAEPLAMYSLRDAKIASRNASKGFYSDPMVNPLRLPTAMLCKNIIKKL
jgi:hypothetical protein